jgi:glycosyltransferase involved in cell wall biosynthesis
VKVTFFSTYPPAPCGIGDYTRELRQAVERAEPGIVVDVVAERHPSVTRELDARVTRAWARSGAWDEEAVAAVLAQRPDLVHVQHEEAILQQNGRLIRFLEALGRAGIARVVTLHSVYGGRLGVPSWWPPPIFHRAMAERCEAIVVHQREGGLDTLVRQGVPAAKVHVIPHGTPISLPLVVSSGVPSARAVARQRLGIPAEARVALFFGVIHAKKNLHTVVEAAGRVAARLPGFRFVVAGRPRRRTILDTLYAQRLARRMAGGRRAGWLDLREGFIPAEDLTSYVAAADVVLFPHDQAYGSASGVFHLALGGGRACICSASPKFGEARELFAATIPGATVPTRDVGAWAASIEAFLSSPAVLRQAEALAERAAADSSWEKVGRLHAELYLDLHLHRGRSGLGQEPALPERAGASSHPAR